MNKTHSITKMVGGTLMMICMLAMFGTGLYLSMVKDIKSASAVTKLSETIEQTTYSDIDGISDMILDKD